VSLDRTNGLKHGQPISGLTQGVTMGDTKRQTAKGKVLWHEAADGKNLEVFSPSIGRQLLERGLMDEIDIHLAPVLLGDGIRLFDNPGGQPIRLQRPEAEDPAVNLRYRPVGSG
jgi:dihydrofolate reductase